MTEHAETILLVEDEADLRETIREVIAEEGYTVPADLVAWAREAMANFKAPRRIEVVDALPLNASGKVLRFELRDRAVDLIGGGA